MTVSYNEKFLKLLLRWRGSLWKCIWKELIVYLSLYYALNFAYRFALTDTQKETFELITLFCNRAQKFIPITFLLGFFVAQVITRWWEQFEEISWPDSLMFEIAAFFPGEENRFIRKTLARWLNLTAVLAWKIVSVKMLKRFPNTEVLVKAGLMTDEEKQIFDNTDAPYGKFWLPNIWMVNLIKTCYEDGRISGLEMEHLIQGINQHRGGLKKLTLYDWISVPLVYTQVSTVATYGYFFVLLMGRQLLDTSRPIPKAAKYPYDLYVPVVMILEFLFYMGWLKVAEELINPFGEDDEDFELNYILDRNINVSYRIAELGVTGPEGDIDPHSGRLAKDILPYTKASLKQGPDIGYKGHLGELKLKDEELTVINPEDISEQTQKSEGGRTWFPHRRGSKSVNSELSHSQIHPAPDPRGPPPTLRLYPPEPYDNLQSSNRTNISPISAEELGRIYRAPSSHLSSNFEGTNRERDRWSRVSEGTNRDRDRMSRDFEPPRDRWSSDSPETSRQKSADSWMRQ